MSYWTDRKVLVTGGAGFIGSNLVKRLVKSGAIIRVVDNLERGKLAHLSPVIGTIDFRQLDLRDEKSAMDTCRGIDTVFHLASKVGGIGYYLQQPGEVMRQNILLDNRVLDAIIKNKVARYIYMSSTFVYPSRLQQTPLSPALKESDAIPAEPPLSYGWAKLSGEKNILYTIEDGFPLKAAILRLMGAYGPGQDIDLERGSAIPVFVRRALEYPQRRPFIIKGTGRETRCFCYIDDIIEAIIRAAENLDGFNLIGPANIGSENRIMINELAELIIKLSGKQITVRHLPASTSIWGQAADCSLARSILDGWYPEITLEDGLSRMFKYVKDALREETTQRQKSLNYAGCN
jgi:nucleoside-diphosphate-sugar epimerase